MWGHSNHWVANCQPGERQRSPACLGMLFLWHLFQQGIMVQLSCHTWGHTKCSLLGNHVPFPWYCGFCDHKFKCFACLEFQRHGMWPCQKTLHLTGKQDWLITTEFDGCSTLLDDGKLLSSSSQHENSFYNECIFTLRITFNVGYYFKRNVFTHFKHTKKYFLLSTTSKHQHSSHISKHNT